MFKKGGILSNADEAFQALFSYTVQTGTYSNQHFFFSRTVGS